MPARVTAVVPEAKGVPTIGELLLPFIQGRPIWNYRVESPISLEDPAFVRVVIVYCTTSKLFPGKTERFEIIGTAVKKLG